MNNPNIIVQHYREARGIISGRVSRWTPKASFSENEIELVAYIMDGVDGKPEIVGFAALKLQQGQAAELEALFKEPYGSPSRGAGTALMDAALAHTVFAEKPYTLEIDSTALAEPFYDQYFERLDERYKREDRPSLLCWRKSRYGIYRISRCDAANA